METSAQEIAERRRTIFLTTVSIVSYRTGIALAAGLVVLYFITSTWQMLPAAIVILLGSALSALAQQQVRKGRLRIGASVIIIAITIVPPLLSLFVQGSGVTTTLIILAWIGNGIVILFGTRPSFRQALGIIASLVATGAILLLENYRSIPRMVVVEPDILQWLLPLTIALGGAWVTLVTVRGILAGRQSTRLNVAFILLILTAVLALGASAILSTWAANPSDLGKAIVMSSMIGALVVLVTAVSVIYTIGMIASSLDNLTRAARRYSQGDRQARARPEQDSEFGILSETFNGMAGQLQNLTIEMEEQVTRRTRNLEQHAAELLTAAQIARDASLAASPEEMLQRMAQLVHDRFGFYHVGIFILDENNEFAVLNAAAGDAGQLMLANRFKVQVGEASIIGNVTKNGEAQIALDFSTTAARLQNSILPYTRSEMTIPLKIGNRILGVLDVQSDKSNEFSQENATAMQILADQVAIALDRSRLIQEIAQNAELIEKGRQENIANTWRTFLQQTRRYPGYQYEGVSIEHLTEPPADSLEVFAKGKPVINEDSTDAAGGSLAVPVQLHGQTLGTLNLRFQNKEVSSETLRLVEEAANRLALALENARLVQDAQRLAKREQQINIISTQIQQSTDLEIVLQNTVRELGNALGVPKTFIQIGLTPPTHQPKKKHEKIQS